MRIGRGTFPRPFFGTGPGVVLAAHYTIRKLKNDYEFQPLLAICRPLFPNGFEKRLYTTLRANMTFFAGRSTTGQRMHYKRIIDKNHDDRYAILSVKKLAQKLNQ